MYGPYTLFASKEFGESGRRPSGIRNLVVRSGCNILSVRDFFSRAWPRAIGVACPTPPPAF